jgi:5-methylcytosine-specific restriction endonuclease McrA
MIYLSPGNKGSIPTILNEIKDKRTIEYLYRDKLGRIQKGRQLSRLLFKTILRCGTKCTHCQKEGLHFSIDNRNKLQLITNDGKLTVEHIIPKSLGGTDIDYNITIFCDICNYSKGNDLLVPAKINVIPKKIKQGKERQSIRYTKILKRHIYNNFKDVSDIGKLIEKIYKAENFKISNKNLNKYIKKFNNYTSSNNMNMFISINDFPENLKY